jgi:hypothetical protein
LPPDQFIIDFCTSTVDAMAAASPEHLAEVNRIADEISETR